MPTNSNPDHASEVSPTRSGPIAYPKDHVVGVIKDHTRMSEAVDRLIDAGFEPSEIRVLAGPAAANRLADSPGRTGFLGKVIRFADKIGVKDEEMEAKATYERALREDAHVISVFAPSEERKDTASEVIRRFGGKDIAHFGEFVITDLRK